jgi:hypothetical protein
MRRPRKMPRFSTGKLSAAAQTARSCESDRASGEGEATGEAERDGRAAETATGDSKGVAGARIACRQTRTSGRLCGSRGNLLPFLLPNYP